MTARGSKENDALRLCQQVCGAKCCRYITVLLPAPKRKADFDELRWFVAHEGISVYVQSRRWHLEVNTRCNYLAPDNLCAIYEDRPDVCRKHDPEDCEQAAPLEYSLRFETAEEFDRWYRKRRERERRKRRQRRAARRA